MTRLDKMYEVKRVETDPFDIMCGECVEHEIEYWTDATEADLHEEHQWQYGADASIPEWEREIMAKQFGWKPTSADFNEWLEEAMADGYIRVKEV